MSGLNIFAKLTTLKTRLINIAGKVPAYLLNALTPSTTYNKTKGQSFGSGARDSLDIYRAKTPKADAPVLIFIHGGAWDRGSKGIYKFLAEGFTKSGYDIVLPNYRLYPDAVFPNFLEDNAKAVAFTAELFPGRPIVLMGHSAGGYNVLMLALKDKFLAKFGVNLCETIIGVVSLSAPVGVIPLVGKPLTDIFPDRHAGEDGILNVVSAPTPPFFLVHGEDDKIVNPVNSTLLAEKVIARGGKAQVSIYPGLSHIGPAQVLSRYFEKKSTLKTDIVNFLESLPANGPYCQ